MPTTESQPPDDLLTTSAPPDTDMLTTERVDDGTTDAAAACNLPGCHADAVTRGLCDEHWSTHRGLADPEGQAPEQDEEVAVP